MNPHFDPKNQFQNETAFLKAGYDQKQFVDVTILIFPASPELSRLNSSVTSSETVDFNDPNHDGSGISDDDDVIIKQNAFRQI